MKATAIDPDGNIVNLNTNIEKTVFCINSNVIEIQVPEGAKAIYCFNNPQLKKINIPDSVWLIQCDKELFIYDDCKAQNVTIYYDF